MDGMTKPRGPMAATAVTAAKIAPGAIVSHVGGTLAADQWPTWPEWAKALFQLGAGAAVTGALALARVDPEIAAGPFVGGITGAGHRAARKVQLNAVVSRWMGGASSSSSSNQVTGGQNQGQNQGQGANEGGQLYAGARRR